MRVGTFIFPKKKKKVDDGTEAHGMMSLTFRVSVPSQLVCSRKSLIDMPRALFPW